MKNLKLFEEWYGEDPEHIMNVIIDNLRDLESYYTDCVDDLKDKLEEFKKINGFDESDDFFNQEQSIRKKWTKFLDKIELKEQTSAEVERIIRQIEGLISCRKL